MRMRGVEPPRAKSPQAPEACASANSATSAVNMIIIGDSRYPVKNFSVNSKTINIYFITELPGVP